MFWLHVASPERLDRIDLSALLANTQRYPQTEPLPVSKQRTDTVADFLNVALPKVIPFLMEASFVGGPRTTDIGINAVSLRVHRDEEKHFAQMEHAFHSQPELTNAGRVGGLAAQSHFPNRSAVAGIEHAIVDREQAGASK
ncbi:MAG: hypothetical protein FJ276_25395 [Planctomycetes bacterium]|nr:hypothetical protein [Planctomycetota bacterium]